MSDVSIGIMMLCAMFGLMVLRMPVGIAMLVAGFFGTWWLNGFNSASALLVTETFSSASTYSLTVIPLFILMGNVASQAGFSRRLYEAAFSWVGQFKGGLASASVLGCAAFSAVSGSSVATAVTIGKVALPEMRRFGYRNSLACGSIAAGGTLGFLIPPSTGFVIYAILTEVSIGQLFVAGILPGLLLTLLFITTIYLVAVFAPGSAPCGEKRDLSEKLKTLYLAAPLLSVIFISIGGIYAGIFTPVESAGIGAILVTLLAFGTKNLNMSQFITSAKDTIITTAVLYMVVIGANILNPFLSLTHIPASLGNLLLSFGLNEFGVLALIILAYIVLGMFMDGLAMLVITIPIFFPIVVGLGFDPIWFGIIAVIVIEMGMITPPVGLNVFIVKGVAGDVPLGQIFKGVFPFWVAMAVCLLLIILFPSIALLLPQSMF